MARPDSTRGSRQTGLSVVVILILVGAAVVLWLTVGGGGRWLLGLLYRYADNTPDIDEYVGERYVLTCPLFLVRDDDGMLLTTGESQRSHPKSLADYQANPRRYPSVADVLPPGTVFQVASLVTVRSPWGAFRRALTVHIDSGRYASQAFEMVSAEELIAFHEIAGRKSWLLREMVRPEPASATGP